MTMINKAARDDMVAAGMPSEQADAVATHIPDWSQFATKADLKDLRSDFHRTLWSVGVIIGAPIYVGVITAVIAYFLR